MSLFDDASLVLTPNGYKGGSPNGKLYSIKPTSGLGDMVVTRNTTATRVNSAGIIESVAINVPRLDYTGGGCPRILVEPLRTNLLLYSEEFDNAYWARSSTTITSNNTTAPDGNTTADRLVLTGTSSTARVISRNVPITTVTTTVTFSTFVKYIDKQYLQLTFGSGFSSNFANFDLINGTLVGGTYGNAKIENYSNGWYRISITSTGASTITCTAFIWVIDSAAALRAADSTSTGTSAYWIWGAQLEDGSNATSYIPTTINALARNADVITKTGVSSLIGQTEGTLFVDVNFEAESIAKYYLTLGNSGAFNIAISARANNKIGMEVFNSTGQVNITSTSTYTTNQRLKIAMTYKLNDFKLYVNGVPQATDTSGTVPATGAVVLGSFATSTSQAMDGINLASIFTTALDNDQCIDLTN